MGPDALFLLDAATVVTMVLVMALPGVIGLMAPGLADEHTRAAQAVAA